MATAVTLDGGPVALDGTVVSVPGDWPRSFIMVESGGTAYRYWVTEGTTDAVYADPLDVPTDVDALDETAGPPGDPGPQGEPGVQGDQGEPGPELDWQGVWNAGAVYVPYDLVVYNGSPYYVLPGAAPVVGTAPIDGVVWARLAQGTYYRGAWAATTAYKAGDIVRNGTTLYAAKVDFTSGAAFDAANWNILVADGATGPPGLVHRGNWAAGTVYAVNDSVVYSGSSYRRLVAGITATNPAADPGNWEAYAIQGGVGPAGPPGSPGAASPRDVAAYVTAGLTANNYETGRITMPSTGVRVFRIVTDHAARVRLYTTPTKRDNDIARAVGVDPTGDHGLLLEIVTTAAMLSLDLSPEVLAANMEGLPDNDMPITVTRLDSGGSAAVTVTMSVQGIE